MAYSRTYTIQSWKKQIGTASEDSAEAVATDSKGNVYIAGYTDGEFSPGQQKGNRDAYLAKFDAGGTQQWLRQMGTSGEDNALALATDAQGNVYVAGSTEGELSPGQQKGASDAYLAKFDFRGDQQWVKQIGTSDYDSAMALTTDAQGNVFIAGATTGELFSGQQKGTMDAYVAKYDTNGSHQWSQQLGGADSTEATALATDENGNVYIAGATLGELTPGQQQGAWDAFLAKYDGRGNRLWVQQLGTSQSDNAIAVATSIEGGVYITGLTRGKLSPGAISEPGETYLARYSDSGGLQWVQQLEQSHSSRATALAADDQGNAYLAGGIFKDNERKNEAYFAKYSREGSQFWRKELGTAADEIAMAVTTDCDGNIYLVGHTEGELMPGQQKGKKDAFLAKYYLYGNLSQEKHHEKMQVKMNQLLEELALLKGQKLPTGHSKDESVLQLRKTMETKMDQLFDALKKPKQGEGKALPSGLDAEMIKAAEKFTSDSRGVLSIAETKKLVAMAEGPQKVMSKEGKKTLAFIYASFNMTDGAEEKLIEALSS